jgi:hypothetical protein
MTGRAVVTKHVSRLQNVQCSKCKEGTVSAKLKITGLRETPEQQINGLTAKVAKHVGGTESHLGGIIAICRNVGAYRIRPPRSASVPIVRGRMPVIPMPDPEMGVYQYAPTDCRPQKIFGSIGTDEARQSIGALLYIDRTRRRKDYERTYLPVGMDFGSR